MYRALVLGPLIALVAPVLVAAPVPKDETGRVQRVYGTKLDPDKGSEFRNAGDTLHITLPLETRLFAPFKRVTNAPRVWREIKGNFTASARVSFTIRPGIPAKHKEPVESRASAGLVVWLDDENFMTVTRDERESDGEPGEYFRSELVNKGIVHGSADYVKPGAIGYMRVQRGAKRIECDYSRDGKKWTPIGSFLVEWNDAVKVGVFAENGFNAPFTATFDDYTLTPAKE